MTENLTPAVSVLIPAYNAGRWIDGCITSIVTQTFSDFEIIIVDDASNDSTATKLEAWRSRDSRIRVIRNVSNRGVAHSLNRGLRECRAELVARMDADDLMKSERLKLQAQYMDQNPDVQVLGGWARIIDLSGTQKVIRRMPIEHSAIVRLMWANPIIHPCVMYRRSAILSLGGYDESAAQREDYDLWFRCAFAKFRFHNLPECLIEYRHDHESFARYDFLAALRQARIGLFGNWRLRGGVSGYVGLLGPLIRSLLPFRWRKHFYSISKCFDPRENVWAGEE